ncbi:glyoxalase [Chryseobacterium sp. CBo1]|uniref:VOC family protein n=1 Tax=Chryseobacterium sp. CBo1 TaxID=1869230 RepID=UPI00081047B7|nr:VOC family protein [Chryseobacterium sp. CBo1]OCK52137.1 glyoxalase [Chryseobacterium sp. CBo1]
MKSNIIWANFGVEDLERTTQFYTALGFKSNGRSDDLTSFFFGENNFIIHFFKKEVLSKNLGLEISDSEKSNEIIFTISAETKEEVDQWSEKIKNSEGKLISNPEEFGDNYYGFMFADPDGHKFNIFMM